MEGHSANFWNEIADQIQRNDGKEQQKIDQKSTKIGPKSVLEALLTHPGAIFPPREPKSAKNAQNCVRGPPPGSKLGPKIHAKSTPKPSKRNTFL